MSDTTNAAPAETVVPAPAATPAPAAVAPKKSNSGLIIVLVILLVLCLCCSAIGGGLYYISRNAESIAKAALDEAQKQAQKQLENQGSTTTTGGTTGGTTTDDNSSFSFSGTLPSGFPTDAPIYPGSKVGYSSSSNGEYSVTLSTTAKVADVMAYYKQNLPKNGWTIESEQSFFGSSITAKKSGKELTVLSFGDDKEADQTYILSVKAN